MCCASDISEKISKFLLSGTLCILSLLKEIEFQAETFEVMVEAFLQAYFPTGLMVMCSWLPFWVETTPGEQMNNKALILFQGLFLLDLN